MGRGEEEAKKEKKKEVRGSAHLPSRDPAKNRSGEVRAGHTRRAWRGGGGRGEEAHVLLSTAQTPAVSHIPPAPGSRRSPRSAGGQQAWGWRWGKKERRGAAAGLLLFLPLAKLRAPWRAAPRPPPSFPFPQRRFVVAVPLRIRGPFDGAVLEARPRRWRYPSRRSAGLPARPGVPEAGPRPLVRLSVRLSVRPRRGAAAAGEPDRGAGCPASGVYLEISTQRIFLGEGNGRGRKKKGKKRARLTAAPSGGRASRARLCSLSADGLALPPASEAEWAGPLSTPCALSSQALPKELKFKLLTPLAQDGAQMEPRGSLGRKAPLSCYCGSDCEDGPAPYAAAG